MSNAPEKSFKMKSIREGLGLDRPLVYIAGKISGLHYDDVVAKFAKREAELSARGFATFNPVAFVDESCDWQEAMRICLAHLPYSDYIDMLPDWQSSKGATWEREVALKLGIPLLVEPSLDFSEMMKTDF
jgi:hypothetical protein